MTASPLCIIQARLHSQRLPEKMLATLAGETLIARGWRIACFAFGKAAVVVAIPQIDKGGPLHAELERLGATVFVYDGDAQDVLGRFHACAHRYRWHPESVIVRYTPDDPFKDIDMLRRVAAGERLPVEQGGEAFTLAQLDAAHLSSSQAREHLTHILSPTAPPSPPNDGTVWTVDTASDLAAARRQVEFEGHESHG